MKPRRFRATIQKQGTNPYVDVPAAVSAAFAGQAREGRVRVEGKIRGVEFRATLIPAGGGRHRLFLNGGIRSAAGVEVGDAVAIELHATPYDVVRPPRDVATALDVGFWLPRRIDSPRFHKIETITPDVHLHLVRVTKPEELDAEIAAWLREAYAVGRQEHLTSSTQESFRS